MTRRRWMADEFSDKRAAVTGAHAAHLSRTLRARVGQEFEIACGDRVRRGVVASVADDRVEFTLGDEVAAHSAVPITLLLAVFKFDRMEWAIEKCTELNVTIIVPVIARRTEKHLAAAAAKRVERWRRIAREAAEQSRRVAPPEIAEPAKLEDALTLCHHERASAREGSALQAAGPQLKVVLAETEHANTLAGILSANADAGPLALAIGPEGGWTGEELRSFEQAHWVSASLGETILRAETAAIAAVAIARAEM